MSKTTDVRWLRRQAEICSVTADQCDWRSRTLWVWITGQGMWWRREASWWRQQQQAWNDFADEIEAAAKAKEEQR